MTWANSAPSGYSRWHSNRSSDGTDRAITTPSAVVMLPRGWLKSRTIVAGVVRVVVELVGLEDRDAVELHEQDDEAHDQPEPEGADLPVHRAAASCRVRGVVGDAQEEGEQHVVGDERRAAVGDERQGDAGERQDADAPRR